MATTTTTRLTGYDAIDYAEEHDIADEDPSLIYLDRTNPPVEVLGIDYEFPADDEAEDVSEWEWYGTVEVRIGGVTYEVGVVIGVPEYLRGTARAAGGDTITPYLSAWFADQSDYMSAPGDDGSKGIAPELYADLLAALAEAAPRLWREAQG